MSTKRKVYTKHDLIVVSLAYEKNFELMIESSLKRNRKEHKKYSQEERRLHALDILIRRALGRTK